MVFPVIDYPHLSFEDMNPYLVGAQKMTDLQSSIQDLLMKREEARRNPEMLEEKLRALRYKALVDKITSELAEPKMKADIAHQEAQARHWAAEEGFENIRLPIEQLKAKTQAEKTKFELEHPLLGLSGAAQQIGAEDYLREKARQQRAQQRAMAPTSQKDMDPAKDKNMDPANNQNLDVDYLALAQKIKERNDLDAEQKKAYTKRAQVYTQSLPFRSLDKDQQKAYIGKAVAMGYQSLEAEKRIIEKDQDLYDMGAEIGLTKDEVDRIEPVYAATTATINKLQNRKGAIAELNVLGKELNKMTVPFMKNMIFGYSPSEIRVAADAAFGNPQAMSNIIKGLTNEEAVGEFIAGMAMAPEYAALRYMSVGGTQLGIESIHHFQNTSQMNLKHFQALTTPGAQAHAIKRIEEISQKMQDAAEKAIVAPEKNQVQQIIAERGNHKKSIDVMANGIRNTIEYDTDEDLRDAMISLGLGA